MLLKDIDSEIQNRQVAGEDEQHIDLSQFEDLQ